MVATVVSTAVPKERIADAPSLTLAESSGVAQLKLVVVAIYTSLKFS
jgi:hypothetical protein